MNGNGPSFGERRLPAAKWMITGRRSVDIGRRYAAGVLCAAALCVAITANAAHRRRHRATPTASATTPPSPTATATPKIRLVPLVLITGGTGEISVPTGTSSAVLDSAEVYDPGSGHFLPVSPLTAHRDRHAAAVLKDGRVLIVGGVNTVLIPLIVFPGPAMPWILSSSERFDPGRGRFTASAAMSTARDDPTATLLDDGRVLVVGGGSASAEIFDPVHNRFT